MRCIKVDEAQWSLRVCATQCTPRCAPHNPPTACRRSFRQKSQSSSLVQPTHDPDCWRMDLSRRKERLVIAPGTERPARSSCDTASTDNLKASSIPSSSHTVSTIFLQTSPSSSCFIRGNNRLCPVRGYLADLAGLGTYPSLSLEVFRKSRSISLSLLPH